jgi:interferon gamma-inducible protein 30
MMPLCSIEAKLKQLLPPFLNQFHFSMFSSNISLPTNLNQSAPFAPPPSPPLTAPPVNVTLYFESLCPDCKDLFVYQLFPAYTKLASTRILNLQLVPYGNAKVFRYGDRFVYACQHGANECLGNKIESCAVKYAAKESLVPFVYCLEYYGPTVHNAQYCSRVHALPWQPLENCMMGQEGDELMFQMAQRTEDLEPSHTFVPWFTVNGVHNDDIQQQMETDMVGYVCKQYKGVKPKECFEK